MPTGYYVQCGPYGQIVEQEDLEWLEDNDWELPTEVIHLTENQHCRKSPPQPPGVACKRPRHGGNNPSGATPGATSSGDPLGSSAAAPPRGGLLKALQHVADLLEDDSNQKGGSRYDSRGWRSAVRRQVKKLCRTYNLQFPKWLDGEGLTIKQFKQRSRWFIEDFMVQRTLGSVLTEADSKDPTPPPSGDDTTHDDGETTDMPTTPQDPPSPPDGLPEQGTATLNDTARPSTARMITHMLSNMVDDLEVLHPGVKEEVKQSMCEGPASSGLPVQGRPACGVNDNDSSPVEDPRQAKSDPPPSPRPMDVDMEETAPLTHQGLPGEGNGVAAENPTEEMSPTSVQPEIGPVESETVSPPVVHSWPEQGQAANDPPVMDGSWTQVSQTSTVESFTLENETPAV